MNSASTNNLTTASSAFTGESNSLSAAFGEVGADINVFDYPVANNAFNSADSAMFESRNPVSDESMDALWNS